MNQTTSQIQPNPFTQKFVIIFAVIFVYLILGKYFEMGVGKWFASIWYIGVLALGVYYFIIRMKNNKPKGKSEIINAQYKVR